MEDAVKVIVATGPTTDLDFLRTARNLGDELVMMLGPGADAPHVYDRLPGVGRVVVLGLDTSYASKLAELRPQIYAPVMPDEKGEIVVRRYEGLVVNLPIALPIPCAA